MAAAAIGIFVDAAEIMRRTIQITIVAHAANLIRHGGRIAALIISISQRVAGRSDDLCDAALSVADKLNRLTPATGDAIRRHRQRIAVAIYDALLAAEDVVIIR